MLYFLGSLAGAMLDPVLLGAGVAAYFIGRAYPGERTLATVLAVAGFALAALALYGFGAQSEQRTVHAVVGLIQATAIAAWTGFCFACAAIGRRLRSPPAKVEE